MKHIEEELQLLREWKYPMSEDFSQQVMKKIHKQQAWKQGKKIISMISAGLVACGCLLFVGYRTDWFMNLPQTMQQTIQSENIDEKEANHFNDTEKVENKENLGNRESMESNFLEDFLDQDTSSKQLEQDVSGDTSGENGRENYVGSVTY